MEPKHSRPRPSTRWGRDVTLPADTITSAERELRFTFPSLAALGLADTAAARLRFTLRWSGEEAPFDAFYVRRAPLPGAPLGQ